MKKTIAVVGTLDTKGSEVAFVQKIVNDRGHRSVIIDTGILGKAKIDVNITRDLVAKAGGSTLQKLIENGNENEAGLIMAKGLKSIVIEMVKKSELHGLLAMGGGVGSMITAPALQALPLGFPKILVSTKVTQAGAAPYAGSRDVTLMPSVADLAGLNRLTRKVLANAAGAVIGMVETEIVETSIKELVVMSMNGTVTGGALHVKNALEKQGYEILIFHTIGTGGRSLEDYISLHPVSAVIEFAINEVGNELFGGMASAGPDRLEGAGRHGIPQIIIPGSADFINFLAPPTVPEALMDRPIHYHNPQATIVRTSVSENRQLGEVIAGKLNRSKSKVFIIWPKDGLSSVDIHGKSFYDPQADMALYRGFTENLDENISFIEVNAHINSPFFADQVINTFKAMMHK